MKTVLVIALTLLAFNSMAAVTQNICSNDLEKVSFQLDKDGNRFLGLTVRLEGLDSTTSKDFTYKAREITSSGESIVFTKKGISEAEIMIQKVSANETVGLLHLQYKGQFQTTLLKCK